MTCGVNLGIFLICLFQAEHVRCLWASQASQSDGNTYVGYSQKNREARFNYPQNRLRQVPPSSEQSSSLNAAVSSFSWGHSTGGNTQTASQPAKSGYSKARLVQGSSAAKSNSQLANLNPVPKQHYQGLSNSIASGNSKSKYDKTQSSLFGAGAPEPNMIPARTKTSASVRAKLVSKTPKTARPSAPKNPSQTEFVNPYRSKLFPGNTQGSYKATSMASSYGKSLPESNKVNGPVFQPRSYSRSYNSKSSGKGPSGKKFALTKTHSIPDKFGGYAIRRLKDPDQEKVSVRKPQQAYVAPQRQASNPAYVAPQQQASNPTYVAPQWQASNQNYETPNKAYVAPQWQATNQAYETPNKAHVAPQRQAAPQAYTSPQAAPFKSQVQSAHKEAKWRRVRPKWGQ
ncbi:uncharacterized protein LOC134874593 isoform X2 [Eleginops maclovinus]|uniref:uncharacterized protein LOC134874593 isoform X2 n=1 Tax=Eleginops maclovinus TaxID=56733 RepID=UPI003080CE26